jgi:hypothetical protein
MSGLEDAGNQVRRRAVAEYEERRHRTAFVEDIQDHRRG